MHVAYYKHRDRKTTMGISGYEGISHDINYGLLHAMHTLDSDTHTSSSCERKVSIPPLLLHGSLILSSCFCFTNGKTKVLRQPGDFSQDHTTTKNSTVGLEPRFSESQLQGCSFCSNETPIVMMVSGSRSLGTKPNSVNYWS